MLSDRSPEAGSGGAAGIRGLERTFRAQPTSLYRNIPLLLGLWLAAPIVSAQECRLTLSGSVSDADEKTPLDKAVIRLREPGLVTMSDEEGHYHFYGLCPGTYTLVVSHVSCDTLVLRIRLTGPLVRNVVLPHSVNQLSEVTVRGVRDMQPAAVKEELGRRDVDESRGQTLGEILRRATGVTVLQTGSTVFKPVIHGLHSQRVLILNNGVRQEGQQWGSEHAPEVDPFIAERFVVLKGAGALRYGPDAIAGAILVEPRALPTDQRFHGSLHTGFATNNRQYVASLMAEQNLPHAPAFSWRAHATYRRGGNARTPDYWLANTGLEEFNQSLTLGYRKPRFRTDLFLSAFNTRLGIFMGSHIGNLTDLENAIRAPRPVLNIDRFGYAIGRPSQQVTHLLVRSRSTWFLPKSDRLVLLAAQQVNRRREYDRALLSDRPELDLDIATTTADLSWEQDPQRAASATLGLGVMRQENVWSGSRFFIPNFLSWNPYAYALRRYRAKRAEGELGLRFDRKSITAYRNRNGALSSEQRTFANLSGSAALGRRLGEHVKLTGNAALAWRAPGINELYVNGLHHGSASFEVGDPALQAEKALNMSLQATYLADTTWEADLTLYSNRIADFINLVPSGTPTLTLRGAYPTFRFLQTDAWLHGADWRVARRLAPRWRVSAKGSLLYARDIRQGDWLQQMPANRVEAEVTWAIPGKRLRDAYLSPSIAHVARQTRIPTDGRDFLAPPPAYALLNLEASAAFAFAGHEAAVNLGVRNLLDTRYRDYMNRFRYFNDETGRNIQLQFRLAF